MNDLRRLRRTARIARSVFHPSSRARLRQTLSRTTNPLAYPARFRWLRRSFVTTIHRTISIVAGRRVQQCGRLRGVGLSEFASARAGGNHPVIGKIVLES